MTVAVNEPTGSVETTSGPPWWLFLITGIAWLLVAMVVLRFDTTSIATVGILLGVVLLGAGFTEFGAAAVRPGWRWAHVVMGFLFLIGGFWAFFRPINAFWALASVLGFLLVFKGSLDIVSSVIMKAVNPLWWLGLVAGILEVLLAFWVSQQFFVPRAALIIVWIGFMAIFRGITEIVLAFSLRRAERDYIAVS
jgi:uncharacterized membrane protein HdeD (DUF308 family)